MNKTVSATERVDQETTEGAIQAAVEKKLTQKRFAWLCIDALENARKDWSFDANLLLKLGLDEPSTRRAAERYLEYGKAIQLVQERLK